MVPPPGYPATRPSSDPARPAPTRSVEALLRDLGPHLRRGDVPTEAPTRWPTGMAPVDRLLGGGFPQGRLGEIAGPPSSGRTALALALLATTTRAGQAVAVVDVGDAFHPETAEAAGVRLERVLWVRAARLREALRCAEILLDACGFALVLLDLATRRAAEKTPRPAVPHAAWSRLARAANATQTALVLVGTQREAGSFAELALEMKLLRAHFVGTPPLLEGLEAQARLVRNRAGPEGHSAPLFLRIPLPGTP